MPMYSFGSFILNAEARTLVRDGQQVALTSRSFDTLLLLVQNSGRLIPKDEFFSTVWRNAIVEEANLTQTIFSVRKVLGDRPKDHRFIVTIPGCGYQFVAEVSEVSVDHDPRPRMLDRIRAGHRQIPQNLLLLGFGATILFVASVLLFSRWNSGAGQAPGLSAATQLTNDGEPKNELITDGASVFYASPTGPNLSHWRTYYVALRGGERRSLSRVSQDLSPIDLSPDRKELMLISSEIRQDNHGWARPGKLWFVGLAAGPPRLPILQAQDAAWSPDGSQIVYASGHQINLARKNGMSDHKLAELPGVPSGLRWAPRGDNIRFTLHSGIALKDSSIWEISSTGGKARPLFPDSRDAQADGQWTPDGNYYLFSRIDKGVSQIWQLSESKPWFGSSRQLPLQVTTGALQCFLPTPSPDGKKLLYYGVLERTLLLKHNRNSGQFAPFLPGISGAHLDFSKDGKWITYSSYPEHALWRAARDGTQRQQISRPGMIAMLPTISPDGTKIAFVGGMAGLPFSVFVLSLNGGSLQHIVRTEPSGLIEPTWSPDDSSLVLGGLGGQSALYRFDFAANRLSMLPASNGLWSPRWSPDGRSIAALSSPGSQLVLYDLKSREVAKVVDLAASNPAWAHDGNHIYFGGNEDDFWYRVRLDNHRVERVASLAETGALPAKPSRGVPTWINRWAGLAPDDSLLTAKETGSIEIYSAEWTKR